MKKPMEHVKGWIRGISNYHYQGRKSNIFLMATPRGGSTWFMEILSSQPGMKYYDEPFNIRRPNVQLDGHFKDWIDLMPEANNDSKILQYLDELIKNKIGVMNPTPFRKHYRLFTNRIVFKIHEIEHLINTIENNFNSKIVYLLRHPIPTTLSRAVFPRLELFINSNYYNEKYLTSNQLHEIRRIYESGSHMQKGILSWCFENLIPLKHSNTQNWLFITYEEILINPVKTCELLAHELDLPRVDLMIDAIDRPATNIKMSGKQTVEILQDKNAERRRNRLVVKWKNRVVKNDERNCFDIMDLFELDTYSEGNYIAHNRYLHFKNTVEKLLL